MLAITAAERVRKLYESSKSPIASASDADAKDVLHDQQQQHEEGHQQANQQQVQSKILTFIANQMHLSTFLPLVIIQVLQDIDLALGAVICVIWVLLVLCLSWLLARKGYIKVFPKKFDFFNLQLYITIIILAYTVQHWIHNWISVYVNGSNTWFMWATILLPNVDNFVMDSVRDRLPAKVAGHLLVRRMALLIAITWASALAVMTIAAIIPAAVNLPPRDMGLMIILCSYVFGLGPMVVAIVTQQAIKTRFTKHIKAAFEQQQQEQQQVVAASQELV